MNNTHEITDIASKKQSERPQNENADLVAHRIGGFFCIDPVSELYYEKDDNKDVWHQIPKLKAEILIEEFLRLYAMSYSSSYLSGIVRLVRSRRIGPVWTVDPLLKPMKNGIYSHKTGELLQYREDYHFNWCLPYSYDHESDCPKIDAWLDYVTNDDEDLVWFLLCWMAAVLSGRSDLQKFLMVTGHGGTGKGVFFRLLSLLVGKENIWPTTFKRLEENRFESSNLFGKRLLIISDSENYRGELSAFKQITGGDAIPFERKGKDPELPFFFHGLATVSANQPLHTSDQTSGIARRQISIHFNRIVTESEKQDRVNFEAELEAELPGLFNKLVKIPQGEITKTIRNLPSTLGRIKLEDEIETNPILAWANDRLVSCIPGKETQIGSAPQSGAFASPSRLYEDYIYYCESQGNKPVALRKFSRLVIDNCVSRGIPTEKTRMPVGGGTILKGLKLRTLNDSNSLLFVKDREGSVKAKPLPVKDTKDTKDSRQ